MTREYISTSEAKQILDKSGLGKVTTTTMIIWTKKYILGKKIGGRWKIDAEKFASFIDTKEKGSN